VAKPLNRLNEILQLLADATVQHNNNNNNKKVKVPNEEVDVCVCGLYL